MKIMISKTRIKTAMLPIAMLFGVIFYKWIGSLTFLSPYLLFIMLGITYCRIDPREFKPTKFQGVLLSVQMILAASVYFLLCFSNHLLAEGVFICVFIPTATAAPVITGMLGGSISFVATYSLLSNVLVAVIGPAVLAAIGDNSQISFFQSFFMIAKTVFPLLILPIIISMLLKRYFPDIRKKIAEKQTVSFYIWAFSLFIVVGSSVSFAIREYAPEKLLTMLWLSIGAFIVCVVQFVIGRKIGGIYGDKISGGQSLGQKNTLLAVWIALTYMNPIASIAPASYVAWQNIINSWQLIKKESANLNHRKRDEKDKNME